MDEEPSEYVKLSSFAMQFEGEAELTGQMMDVFLRKHYTTLEVSELERYFPNRTEEEIKEIVDKFVEQDLLVDEGSSYTVNKDKPIIQELREEQKDMMG